MPLLRSALLVAATLGVAESSLAQSSDGPGLELCKGGKAYGVNSTVCTQASTFGSGDGFGLFAEYGKGWGLDTQPAYVVGNQNGDLYLHARNGITMRDRIKMSNQVISELARGRAGSDAVNVSQLKEVVAGFGGGAKVNPDGTVTAPAYTVGGKTVNNVGDAITNVDGRVTNNSTAITNLGDQINNGAVGLVQQDPTSKNITVAKDKLGKRVSFAGSEGDRVLANVAKGAVSVTSVEGINGSQLYGTNKSLVDSLGGGSKLNPDGTVSGPTYIVDGKPVTNVGDAITNIDGRVTNNTTNITKLGDQISNGTVGLVQQDPTSKNITVARAKDGKRVDFSGTAGSRVLMGASRVR